ncbi:hypothetical protein Scep_011973 [Stephania cephalantha]|uniref:Bulb-type lectin domain-containing protein n=1 Tax=Stephania cephalantha TaxID=152367 RepID=A0AAP0P8X8_9MAGN
MASLCLVTLKAKRYGGSMIGLATEKLSYAAMLDTGNFVLEERNMSTYLWESFKVPTNIMLPTHVLELEGKFDSHRERNYSREGSSSRLVNDETWCLIGNVASEFAYAAYYLGQTFQTGYHQVVFNESGYVCVLRREFNQRVGDDLEFNPNRALN